MSHRTDDLAPGGAFTRLLRKLRYHEASRQALAIVLMLWFSVTAAPAELLLAVGTPFIAAGTALRLFASGFITKNRELATDGPYALVRHPLYTGNIAIVSGFAIASSQWWAAVIALAFFWFYYPTAVEYEDRKLHKPVRRPVAAMGGGRAGAHAHVQGPGQGGLRRVVVPQEPPAEWRARDRAHRRCVPRQYHQATAMNACIDLPDAIGSERANLSAGRRNET